MGLFDNIQCEMPMPEGSESVREWQTKDLDCSMRHYAIRRDGSLVDTHLRMEPRPGAPAAPDMFSPEYSAYRREWWEQKQGPDTPIHYTGSVTFYGEAADEQWWEFCAFIENGTCFRLIQIEPTPVPAP